MALSTLGKMSRARISGRLSSDPSRVKSDNNPYVTSHNVFILILGQTHLVSFSQRDRYRDSSSPALVAPER